MSGPLATSIGAARARAPSRSALPTADRALLHSDSVSSIPGELARSSGWIRAAMFYSGSYVMLKSEAAAAVLPRRMPNGAADADADQRATRARERWARVKQELRVAFGENIFSSWFASMEVVASDGETVRFSVPTRFLKSWIQ